MKLIKKSEDVTEVSTFPKRLTINEKYIVDLRPFYFGIGYLTAILLLVVGAYLFGAGISYSDNRVENQRLERLALMAKSDAESAKTVKEQVEREKRLSDVRF